MQKFLCEVKINNNNQTIVVQAESVEAARNLLISKGWKVVSVSPIASL